MIPRIVPAVLLLAVAFRPAGAQTPSAESEAFCQLSGEELVRSLEGSWTLDQGPGSVLYPIAQPLPDQAPIGVRFTWNAEEGVIEAVAADLSGDMVLYPASGWEQEQAEEWVGLGAGEAVDSGCGWSTTPVVVGTNWYYSGAGELYSWMLWQEFCSEPGNAEWVGPQCDPSDPMWSPPPSQFEMEMTLMLRFQTPDYGAGGVFFQGSTVVEGKTYRFGAQAGVTISRN